MEEIFAAGEPQIVDITELHQEDLVACVAMVGAPSAADQYISNEQLCWSYRSMNNYIKFFVWEIGQNIAFSKRNSIRNL